MQQKQLVIKQKIEAIKIQSMLKNCHSHATYRVITKELVTCSR